MIEIYGKSILSFLYHLVDSGRTTWATAWMMMMSSRSSLNWSSCKSFSIHWICKLISIFFGTLWWWDDNRMKKRFSMLREIFHSFQFPTHDTLPRLRPHSSACCLNEKRKKNVNKGALFWWFIVYFLRQFLFSTLQRTQFIYGNVSKIFYL